MKKCQICGNTNKKIYGYSYFTLCINCISKANIVFEDEILNDKELYEELLNGIATIFATSGFDVLPTPVNIVKTNRHSTYIKSVYGEADVDKNTIKIGIPQIYVKSSFLTVFEHEYYHIQDPTLRHDQMPDIYDSYLYWEEFIKKIDEN